MIIERFTPLAYTDIIPTGHGRCAWCGKKATKILNVPGNILAPTCADSTCAGNNQTGALEVECVS